MLKICQSSFISTNKAGENIERCINTPRPLNTPLSHVVTKRKGVCDHLELHPCKLPRVKIIWQDFYLCLFIHRASTIITYACILLLWWYTFKIVWNVDKLMWVNLVAHSINVHWYLQLGCIFTIQFTLGQTHITILTTWKIYANIMRH